ncbi:2-phospho-L-lactate guanylyltransferase [Natronobacterium gregoryi]|uniref:2-phospho-L-lactate guanylyltransferase n=2 Tax=Natronobacterium gregoryi TaxID=44930 RepID=L0AEL9_NATGS|nr:2-phospho-L-lactate guanylyltransferase [Natronobacterium gregoryi]AFZ72353.1 2-phospho-L-lactate guanylyltransferase [Natronobacterium gregoryi SP2]ELY64262.1 2-phospho-L-lactate guanylyltransferase CofC [Natronobacterium gregoryi SP2]PLK20332.1 2-phospho-L-lactate guanylyltransferase [Natronobacterium gregoryi SP2]SFJ22537.1 phospholactate guanylyltransferase [Natronobacterium gregoryi]
MQVVVPFAAESPKTRLESVLSFSEREALARAMLGDVLEAILETGHEPTVVSTARLSPESESDPVTGHADIGTLVDRGVTIEVDDRPLTDAVNTRLTAANGPVAVVMADLALATPDALTKLFATTADVAIAPGLGGGTNALLASHPEFRVDYHGASYLDHCRIAGEIDASLETVDSFRLATDVDEPTDLVELLVHGSERQRALSTLLAFGFDLETTAGRTDLRRVK